jgi:kynureninase
MLSVQVNSGDTKALMAKFEKRGIIIDFREPDILRMSPNLMYNNFQDCYQLAMAIKESF